jgi:hypothetical protein
LTQQQQGATQVFELYTDADLADDNIKVFTTITGSGKFDSATMAVESFVVSQFSLDTDNNISATRLCPFVVNQSLKLEEATNMALSTGGLTDGVGTGKVTSIAHGSGVVTMSMDAPTHFTETVNVATTKVLCNTPAIIGNGFNPQYGFRGVPYNITEYHFNYIAPDSSVLFGTFDGISSCYYTIRNLHLTIEVQTPVPDQLSQLMWQTNSSYEYNSISGFYATIQN